MPSNNEPKTTRSLGSAKEQFPAFCRIEAIIMTQHAQLGVGAFKELFILWWPDSGRYPCLII